MTSRRAFLRAGGVAGLAGLGASLACSADGDGAAESDDNLGFAGTVLGIPLQKPTIAFTDTSGDAYDVVAETAGQLTLMLFGYTSCPDVCPVHLSILASTLDRMSGPASKANVLFVGVDNARDTPEAMRAFLDSRDPEFVGLNADPEELDDALQLLQLPPAVIEPPRADGTYVVGHPSQILCFTPDDRCHIVYPFGVVEQEWATDLPRLMTFDWPDTRR